jgi:glycosyltransferase involved in cell wall biosynthesis
MAGNPTLSIVVPTRNRYPYLASLAKSLLAMKSQDFEVIIHDNSDDNRPYFELFGTLEDSRLRYSYSPGPMSITQNFERSLSLAAGEFVCMIGDDDGVTESIIDLAYWMRSAKIEAAMTPVATYLWPGVGSIHEGAQSQGVLRLPLYSGRVELISESAAVNAVLSSGGIRLGDLPSIYGGVIAKRVLERLKSHAGTYFPGPSPDMANAIGLSAFVEVFARVGMPIYVSGSCPTSGAAEGARHSHQGEIADRSFLDRDTAELWPDGVPFYFSGPTIWAASVIRALRAIGRADLVAQLRFDRLLAACAVFNPLYRSRVDRVRTKNPALVSSLAYRRAICWVWWQRLKALVGNLLQRVGAPMFRKRRVTGLRDIGEVVTHLTESADWAPYKRLLKL